MSFLPQIDVILVEATHPGNIGAAARSLKTMGLANLVLVKPKRYPHPDATQRAAGANDVLQAARVVDTLADAIKDATLVIGTSVREREVSWPMHSPRDTAGLAADHLLADADHRLAVLFGREHSGLSNEELDCCSAQIRIPANEEYASLNLASAVQIVAYELRLAALAVDSQIVEAKKKPRQQAATFNQRQGHLHHLSQVLDDLDFAHNANSPLLMRKLTRLYNKADLTVEEIQILRGILTAIQSHAGRS